MSEMLASFKCNIIDYINFFTNSCVFYFVLLLLLLFFWWFLNYDTINNFLLILILCSSGILALCATLQSETNKVMNEWMNSGMQIFKFMRHKCKLSFPSSLPHPTTSRNPMRACSQTNIKLAALCQKSHIRLMEFTSGHLPMIFP